VAVPPANDPKASEAFENETEPLVLWTTAVACLLAFAGVLLTVRDRLSPRRTSCD
jgi:hypothetical protein